MFMVSFKRTAYRDWEHGIVAETDEDFYAIIKRYNINAVGEKLSKEIMDNLPAMFYTNTYDYPLCNVYIGPYRKCVDSYYECNGRFSGKHEVRPLWVEVGGDDDGC